MEKEYLIIYFICLVVHTADICWGFFFLTKEKERIDSFLLHDEDMEKTSHISKNKINKSIIKYKKEIEEQQRLGAVQSVSCG